MLNCSTCKVNTAIQLKMLFESSKLSREPYLASISAGALIIFPCSYTNEFVRFTPIMVPWRYLLCSPIKYSQFIRQLDTKNILWIVEMVKRHLTFFFNHSNKTHKKYLNYVVAHCVFCLGGKKMLFVYLIKVDICVQQPKSCYYLYEHLGEQSQLWS